MRPIRLWSFTFAGLLALFAAPALRAQLRLAAQQSLVADITITPHDPTVFVVNESPEIFALDVPAIPSSGYVLFTSSVVWQLDTTGNAPVRTNFQLRFVVTSPALPQGVVFGFGVPMTFFRDNGGSQVFLGGTSVDAEPLTRKLVADFLLAENPTILTEATASQVADDLFRKGFHVSVFARLRSQNIADAIASNPNVAFFGEPGSREAQEKSSLLPVPSSNGGPLAFIGPHSAVPLTDLDRDDRRGRPQPQSRAVASPRS